jgi:hypothetical protein
MYVIPNLRKNSAEFKRFYDEERVPKLGEIIWLLDTIVRETGIETIERSGLAFQRIIEKYNLKDCLFIGSPS